MASLQTLKNTFLPGISASQDFFELLRRIERATPEQGRLGTQRDRSHLRLRIIQPADMGFAPREVSDIRQTLNTHQHLAEITIFLPPFWFICPVWPVANTCYRTCS